MIVIVVAVQNTRLTGVQRIKSILGKRSLALTLYSLRSTVSLIVRIFTIFLHVALYPRTQVCSHVVPPFVKGLGGI